MQQHKILITTRKAPSIMAAPTFQSEPEPKKLNTYEEQAEPIFNQFRNNKHRMFKLKHALDALKLGSDGLKLCMMKIAVVNACAPVPFTMASVETETHNSMERDDGVTADSFAAGTIFTDGMFILENYFKSGALPKNRELRKVLAKLLEYLSETGEKISQNSIFAQVEELP